MLCYIKYLLLKLHPPKEGVQVYCKNTCCRFHRNTGQFTQCAQPLQCHKHSSKGIVCSYTFMSGCACADCRTSDCPFKSQRVEDTGVPFEAISASEFITLIIIELIVAVVTYY